MKNIIDYLGILKSEPWFNHLVMILALILPGFYHVRINEPTLLTEVNVLVLLLHFLLYSIPCFVIIMLGVEINWGKQMKEVADNAKQISFEAKTLHKAASKFDVLHKETGLLEYQISEINNHVNYSHAKYSATAGFVIMTFYISVFVYKTMPGLMGLLGTSPFLKVLYANCILYFLIFTLARGGRKIILWCKKVKS